MTPVDLLLAKTKFAIYICSLPNEHGASGEQHVLTRNKDTIKAFIKRHDKPGRGLFFCVSTIEGSKRNKANARECCFLHADIDFKDTTEEILERVCKWLPPTIIVRSGNGAHMYWAFDKPAKCSSRIETMLKQITRIAGGDKAVTHQAALLRLPGSHNSKKRGWKLVTEKTTGPRYALKKLSTILDKSRPLAPDKAIDFFEQHGEQYKAPIDVAERLSLMEYHGSGDSSIHTTQLSCVASLANHGMDEDEVINVIIPETKTAARRLHWNWPMEEMKLRKMYRSWIAKKKSGA